ncbi:NERD domain-containing protein [Streptococcus panodentis]|uniref:Topoisomerase n=1 Tax=Streptococcus panodentis TaxID=1581472 RepID=A0ABS5AZK3_9STRE|nr:NERD domain-containing protein [Streptococcus panodentis]MBP2621935.1 topoisomerase [Streptococcus panodentis]
MPGSMFVGLVMIFILVFGISYRILAKKEEADQPETSNQEPDYFQQTRTAPWELKHNRGKQGEYQLGQVLSQLSGYKKILFNLYVFKENGTTTEIDALLIHPSGIYIFESKNYRGWIFGSEHQQYWTQVLATGRGRSHKQSFFNPIIQNKIHLKWLSYYLNEYAPDLYSYIVFSNDCELKEIHLKSDRHKVIQTWQALGAIEQQAGQTGAKLAAEQIDDLYRMLLPLTKRNQVVKERHIKAIAQNRQKIETENICPRCQSRLVLRTAAKGARAGQQFWGCSSFPRCRFTQQWEGPASSPIAEAGPQATDVGQPVLQEQGKIESNS